MKLLLDSFLLLMIGCVALELQGQSLWVEANGAYKNEDYTTAIASYEQLLKEGQHSNVLYYNLGNSYYKNEQLGLAILNYEKGLLLAPGDKDLSHNLLVARTKVETQLDPIPEFFLDRWWRSIILAMSSLGWSILGLSLLAGGCMGLMLWRIGQTRLQKKWGLLIGGSLVVISLFVLWIAQSRKDFELDSGYAVVITEKIDLKSGADDKSTTIFQLTEGVKVKVLDKIGNWNKVQLADGELGWLQENTLLPIKV